HGQERFLLIQHAEACITIAAPSGSCLDELGAVPEPSLFAGIDKTIPLVALDFGSGPELQFCPHARNVPSSGFGAKESRANQFKRLWVAVANSAGLKVERSRVHP